MGSYSDLSKKASLADVIFIGPIWAACWGALKAKERGLTAKVLPASGQKAPEGIFVHEGNGEAHAKAEKIFGKERAESLWTLSKRNFAAARSLGLAAGALWSESGTIWPDSPTEPGLVLRRSVLEKYLSVQTGKNAARDGWDSRIRKHGPFDFEVGGERAKTVCLLGDAFRPELSPFLKDKWIPCTLSSFAYPTGTVPEGSLFLFHSGADFAVREGNALRVGSYRNLYSERGVGFHEQPDQLTRENTQTFFSKMGYIGPKEVDSRLQIATLTGDGLPLVGPFPEDPGVFLVGGFAGREANFLFAVLDNLADALADRGVEPLLEPYSTKRFT